MPAAPTPVLNAPSRSALGALPFALCTLALVVLWGVVIWRLGGMWSALPEYSYGWSVPVLCLMLLWERWKNRPGVNQRTEIEKQRSEVRPSDLRPLSSDSPPPSGSVSGPVVSGLVVFSLLFILSRLALEVIPNWRIAAWALALSAVTITLLLLRLMLGGQPPSGSVSTSDLRPPTSGSVSSSDLRPQTSVRGPSSVVPWSWFAFPILFFLLAVPWPSRFEVPFIQFLTELNAGITVEVLSFLKVAAVRMGNIILIEPGLVGVQEACSGIRSFQSTLMVALFLGELFRFTWWRRVLFVLLGVGCSLVFNIVRTTFLVLECNRQGLQAVDKFHDPAGWTVFAASFVCLALVGWLLYRQQAKARSAKREAPPSPRWGEGVRRTDEVSSLRPLHSDTQVSSLKSHVSAFIFQRFSLFFPVLLHAALVTTELGISWWFNAHAAKREQTIDWIAAFPDPSSASPFQPLEISKEVQGMLKYDRGGGWQWQGGGGERWQAFLFEWDAPKTVAEKILCAGQALGHQPELCFTRAGMQLRRRYDARVYQVNGVPLVFKAYEFTDRNVPIFVFSCTWERGQRRRLGEEELIVGDASTFRGIHEAIFRFQHGDRGITDDVRVLKFGVWGPRTIGEAEFALQQQLAFMLRPKAGPLDH